MLIKHRISTHASPMQNYMTTYVICPLKLIPLRDKLEKDKQSFTSYGGSDLSAYFTRNSLILL